MENQFQSNFVIRDYKRYKYALTNIWQNRENQFRTNYEQD